MSVDAVQSGGPSPRAQESAPSPAPEAPKVESARSLPTNTDFNAKVAGAKTLAEYQALKAEAMKAKPMEAKPEAAKTAKDIPPDLAALEDKTPETTAALEVAPEAEPEPTPEPAKPEDEPEEDADEADGPPKIPTAKTLRLSPAQHDQVGRLTAALMKRNRDLTMAEAMDRAKDQLGIKPKTEAKEEIKPKSEFPETVEAVDQTLDQLETEYEKANADLRFEDAAKVMRQIRRLDRHRNTLERDGERRQQEEVASYGRAFETSTKKAEELYEFAKDPASEGGKRMIEIESELKANDDPLYSDPNKPLKLAQMAARELNIAPKRKGAPPAPAKAAAPVVPAPKKQVLPSGSSRTAPAPINQPPADVAKVQGIKNLADLRAMRRSLGLEA